VVDFVTENDKGCRLQLLHSEQGVQLGFGFGEALVIFCVDEEDDAADFGDCKREVSKCSSYSLQNVLYKRRTVIPPQPACLSVPTQVEGRELYIAD
jgi:hypothetical protein